MVEMEHYFQCSMEYGLCRLEESFQANGIARFGGLNLFSSIILSEITF
jgi:hypothetical protein